MRRITLNRNGAVNPRKVETSDLKAGRFRPGEHVLLRITGDCCWHSGAYFEYVVADVRPCDRFGGGRETVTFSREGGEA